MINVTKTFLPPLEEYAVYLKSIWEKGWVTNHGELSNRLEEELKSHLGVDDLILTVNGTIALQIAIKSLNLRGEIITTPFSYVATTSSIVWENCKPVFVDIDPETMCVNVEKIEEAITDNTQAILVTHVYGIPCEIEKIKAIADQHDLSVVYDAAHAFDVQYNGKSILNYGDISVLSFHATKLFHTVEGGAIVTSDRQLAHRARYMRNFGHNGEEAFFGLGINGKISELHSAMGLCLLPRVKKMIERRKRMTDAYDRLLGDSRLTKPKLNSNATYNYSYYPIIFDSEQQLQQVRSCLNAEEIFPRRYFFPPLNTLEYVGSQSVPIAEDISRRIMCLPLYDGLESEAIEKIAAIISKAF